ncbi:MAG: lactate utilization protein [Anaerovoracaceae bacterium]|nr:lactate utilization protein [Anaerovoracaceae bacterium]
MAELRKAKENLERKGYTVNLFETGAEAAAYLNEQIDGTSVAIGGMKTAEQLGLFDSLAEHNDTVWHWRQDPAEALKKAMTTDRYISSANAISEDGTIVNIDHTGNRLSSILFGHNKVYLVIGVNKLTDTTEDAIWRARNIAAPQRAKSMGRKTPCVFKDKCFDCKSPDRLCRGMLVLMYPMGSSEMEIILVNEELGM